MKGSILACFTFFSLVLPLLRAGNAAPPSSPNKSQYNLFHPTPRDLLRDLAPDRPDTTESPVTVDAGHFQIETSFFDYSRDKSDGTRTEVFTYSSLNLKVGLTNSMDAQLLFDAYTIEESKDRETDQTEKPGSFSDITFRLKVNVWGNDGGKTAFAIFPFVEIPTGTKLSSDRVEGGLILPFSMGINDRLDFGAMLETDAVYNPDTDTYELAVVHTAVLGVAIADPVHLYLEYVGSAGTGEQRYQATFSGGLTFPVTPDLQLDAGVRLGLNDAAEDFGCFTGMTMRF
ncbi:MAG TPA: transporter [Chthoniobacterales bacterium]